MTTESENTPYIVIRRTITFVDRVPFNSDFYPNISTLQDACNYERELDFADKMESFISNLEGASENEIDFEETITVDINCPFRHAECVTSCITPFHCQRGTATYPKAEAEDTTGNRKDFEYDVYKSHAEWEREHFPQK